MTVMKSRVSAAIRHEEAGEKYDTVYQEYIRTAEWFESIESPMLKRS